MPEQKNDTLDPVDNALIMGREAGSFTPVTLPCGLSLQNRLVKVAMYEHLAAMYGGPPNEYHFGLYSQWARYGWGMLLTGNVQVSKTHLTLGRDMVVPDIFTEETLRPFQILAASMHGDFASESGASSNSCKTRAIMQLNHSGRQSSNFIGGRGLFQPPLAPSAIPVGSKDTGFISRMVNRILFQTPQEMTMDDINNVVNSFVHGARLASQSGFDGVQLHVAHGYLLAQFITPKTNKRTDQFSVDPANVLRLLKLIVTSIRNSVPTGFAVGLKFNAGDYVTPTTSGGNAAATVSPVSDQERRALLHIVEISQWGGIDFIEISGGDYEKPDFMSSANYSSKSSRQALFARFSRQAVQALESLPRTLSSPPLPLILLTGGLRTPAFLNTVLASRHADLLGIGRGAVLCPNLPEVLKQREQNLGKWNDVSFSPEPDLDNPTFLIYPPISWLWSLMPNVPLIGAGVGMAWYVVMIRHLAMITRTGRPINPKELQPDYSIGGLGAVFRMWAWINTPTFKSPLILLACSTIVSALFAFIVQFASS